jgi:hypothetical protein
MMLSQKVSSLAHHHSPQRNRRIRNGIFSLAEYCYTVAVGWVRQRTGRLHRISARSRNRILVILKRVVRDISSTVLTCPPCLLLLPRPLHSACIFLSAGHYLL